MLDLLHSSPTRCVDKSLSTPAAALRAVTAEVGNRVGLFGHVATADTDDNGAIDLRGAPNGRVSCPPESSSKFNQANH